MRAAFCFMSPLIALSVITLSLVPAGAVAEEAPSLVPSIVQEKAGIEFRLGKNLVTRYIVADTVAKPYFWPVNAIPGVSVTRSWPMEKDEHEATDHVHQKSMWFCYGDVLPDGVEFKKHFRDVAGVDFWSERSGHGKMVCVKVEEPTMSKESASIATHNEWRTSEGKKLLSEKRAITLVPLGENRTLLIFDIEFLADVCPITFADTKEGAFGVRVRESLRVTADPKVKKGPIPLNKGVMTNAEGKSGEKVIWGNVSNWVDYSGPVDAKGTIAGIAVFADPKNTYDSAWHARGYGLLAANPFGRDKHAKFPARKGNDTLVKLEKGGTLALRYGVFLHQGDAKEGKVADAFAKFKELKAK
jgi:hypothetical protein